MTWFNKKNKEKEMNTQEYIDALVNFILKTRELKWTDEQILQKFNEKKYPFSWIEESFKIANSQRENKITKLKEEEKMAEYEDEELDVSDVTSDEDLEGIEQEIEQPVQKQKVIQKPIAKQVKQQAPIQKTQQKQSADKYEYVYQREMAGIMDKTSGQVTTDLLMVLTDIRNSLERIEQSL